MNASNLGTKRQCPKCAAKFYDFGASGPITCPKCAHSWKDTEGSKPAKSKAKKEKPPAPVKKVVPVVIPPELEDSLPAELPEVEEGGEIEELEPMEEEEVEMTSLEEVEEHEEEKVDPDSDDAEDEMFTVVGEEKLVDDLEQYIETDEDHEEDDDGNEEE